MTNKAGQATIIVTKSSKSASSVCGRLGDGRLLPVFICFAFGESFEHEWGPHIVSEDIIDKYGDGLAWHYINNVKGFIKGVVCSLHEGDHSSCAWLS